MFEINDYSISDVTQFLIYYTKLKYYQYFIPAASNILLEAIVEFFSLCLSDKYIISLIPD